MRTHNISLQKLDSSRLLVTVGVGYSLRNPAKHDTLAACAVMIIDGKAGVLAATRVVGGKLVDVTQSLPAVVARKAIDAARAYARKSTERATQRATAPRRRAMVAF